MSWWESREVVGLAIKVVFTLQRYSVAKTVYRIHQNVLPYSRATQQLTPWARRPACAAIDDETGTVAATIGARICSQR